MSLLNNGNVSVYVNAASSESYRVILGWTGVGENQGSLVTVFVTSFIRIATQLLERESQNPL